MKKEILERIKGGLIVSCQALPEEPLHSSYIMSRMAYAAMEGGAVGIRANSVADIREIKKTVDLPVIGIIKKVYADSSVYITPTMEEIDALAACGADIIATDGTLRMRPQGESLDCSTYEAGMHAEEIGFDLIGTTMSGYTDYTAGKSLPDITMMESMVGGLKKPGIAEGGIWTPEQFKTVMETGILAAVVGTAITRPREITRHFLTALDRA